ncbi:DinB family protein [Aquimarina aquimarini]|uniref:DinB family protein n=1 Tax=Aquimarina aquimarini TaxID=1191734 RepID=UPI000D55D830|nr:DinB family protein [Aquimarina aquimarini]
MIHKLMVCFLLVSGVAMSQQSTPKDAFLEKWKNSKDYLLKIAEQMPEDRYNYKPTEREMSFKEQLFHIRGNMLWLGTTYFSEEKFDREQSNSNLPETKTEIIELVSAAFDTVYTQIQNTKDNDLSLEVDFFAGPKSKLQILNLLQDHVTHHRGQLIVYLNLNDVKPPDFVGW